MPYVLVSVAERVATITLNDPARRNAINLALNDELIAAIDEIERRDDIGAIVLTGAPPAFCAGADLEDLKNSRHRESLGKIYAGFLRLAHTSLPTVAAVNGAAVGGRHEHGTRVRRDPRGTPRADSTPGSCRSVSIPAADTTWRLRRITDHQTVMAMVLFGEAVDGERAAEIGLAWRCVDDARSARGGDGIGGTCGVVPPRAHKPNEVHHPATAGRRFVRRGGRPTNSIRKRGRWINRPSWNWSPSCRNRSPATRNDRSSADPRAEELVATLSHSSAVIA